MTTRARSVRTAPRPSRPARYRFTVAQYERMGETGILGQDEHVELIKGEVIRMPPMGRAHRVRVNRITRLFGRTVGDRAIMQVQSSLALGDEHEPEPDVALLRWRDDFYETAGPDAGDVLLVVEVSDTSLAYDLETKVPFYAQHLIPEVWDWDLPNHQVHVFRNPADGSYRERFIAHPGDALEVAALPGVRIAVSDVLGPVPR